jgi:maltose O-acetyltransferase
MAGMDWLRGLWQGVHDARMRRRWQALQSRGMRIGRNVHLPDSTWVDSTHCNLISIGDNCGFGAQCLILSHDALMNEFLDAARIGRVIIHESCHFGARTVILPGVEIGPRTIVGANSVVSRSLPPDSVCLGNPARPVCTLMEYLQKHREAMKSRKTFDFMLYDMQYLTPERSAELVDAVKDGDAYVIGGRTADKKGKGSTRYLNP